MPPEIKLNISRISRYLYIYASMILVGVLWNIADGEIENIRDFVRGIIRGIAMFYLSKTIWQLKKVNWWAITIASCIFAILGIMGIIIGLVGGVVYENTQLLQIGIIVIPATLILLKVFQLAIKKEVREKFIN